MAAKSPPLPADDRGDESPELKALRFMRRGWDGGMSFLLLLVIPRYTAEGMVNLNSTFGTKASQVPLLGIPFRIGSAATISLGLVAALMVFICVAAAWRFILRAHVMPHTETTLDVEAAKGLVTPIGIGLILCDAAFLYLGMVQMNWGRATFSLSALLVTVTLSLSLVFVTLVSLKLEDEIRKMEGK